MNPHSCTADNNLTDSSIGADEGKLASRVPETQLKRQRGVKISFYVFKIGRLTKNLLSGNLLAPLCGGAAGLVIGNLIIETLSAFIL